MGFREGRSTTQHFARSYNYAYIVYKHMILYILNGSDDGVSHSELLGFWTLPIFRYSWNWKTRRFGTWICFLPEVRVCEAEHTYSVRSLRQN
jgi:hypothetical protein